MVEHILECSKCGGEFHGKGTTKEVAFENAMLKFEKHSCCLQHEQEQNGWINWMDELFQERKYPYAV